jgi:hypothetical protein
MFEGPGMSARTGVPVQVRPTLMWRWRPSARKVTTRAWSTRSTRTRLWVSVRVTGSAM